ncbi:hypothetical protein SAMN05660226_00280 [Parapedobacter luteus]|uniref:Polymerase/histidinol phosphatase N-terminal domain-containing protein n=1 Tax=Parapedobacter luteus TaxID=623280 RepID=A0A1T4ZXX1_9SPHI|nr:hypothetical protein [Parapedobacter luteus]SKB27570.1 hypothetical protein SAMN05660226_00280 [Parapedobacter luteus]
MTYIKISLGIALAFLFVNFKGVDKKPTSKASTGKNRVVVNPYGNVNWQTFEKHHAALHVHSLQSDGFHKVKDVIDTFRQAGFTILSITDHDWNWPNERISWKHLPVEAATPYPIGRLPKNFPANPTWPWTNYGSSTPEELGMIGIQGNELTFRHHINSYFSDYGVYYDKTGPEAPYGGITDDEGREVWEDDMIRGVREKGGLTVLNHPGELETHSWWLRRPVEWYVERFTSNPADGLVGIEVTNNDDEREKFDIGLWDQLLARLMPDRPVWGFGGNDMHAFDHVNYTFTVFLIDEFTTEAVRDAMERGQFYFCKAPGRTDVRQYDFNAFPTIDNIGIDQRNNTITITASNYDKINWISVPETLEMLADYKTSNEPWALGNIVHEGSTLDLNSNPGIRNYVRAELIRIDGDNVYRTFTNPFGISSSN